MSDNLEYPAIVHWRRAWAQRFLDQTDGWLHYGSREWNELPLDDPRRLAAAIAAAEIYTRDRFDDLDEWTQAELTTLAADLARIESGGALG